MCDSRGVRIVLIISMISIEFSRYSSLLRDCYYAYFAARSQLLTPIIASQMVGDSGSLDLIGFVSFLLCLETNIICDRLAMGLCLC